MSFRQKLILLEKLSVTAVAKFFVFFHISTVQRQLMKVQHFCRHDSSARWVLVVTWFRNAPGIERRVSLIMSTNHIFLGNTEWHRNGPSTGPLLLGDGFWIVYCSVCSNILYHSKYYKAWFKKKKPPIWNVMNATLATKLEFADIASNVKEFRSTHRHVKQKWIVAAEARTNWVCNKKMGPLWMSTVLHAHILDMMEYISMYAISNPALDLLLIEVELD